jgi:hypothetical protein
LWVEFQLQDLCETETDHEIKVVLQNLPESLSETYDRLLSKLENLQKQNLIKRMFQWIVCARRPLRVEELLEGISFTLDDKTWTHDKIVTNFHHLVKGCSNLVVIHEETQTVQLAHVSDDSRKPPVLPQNTDSNFLEVYRPSISSPTQEEPVSILSSRCKYYGRGVLSRVP